MDDTAEAKAYQDVSFTSICSFVYFLYIWKVTRIGIQQIHAFLCYLIYDRWPRVISQLVILYCYMSEDDSIGHFILLLFIIMCFSFILLCGITTLKLIFFLGVQLHLDFLLADFAVINLIICLLLGWCFYLPSVQFYR